MEDEDQLTILTRQIGVLTATIQHNRSDTAEVRRLVTEVREVVVEQSGALAVVASEALSNRKAVEELKKKPESKSSESSYWKLRFDSLKAQEKEIGSRPLPPSLKKTPES